MSAALLGLFALSGPTFGALTAGLELYYSFDNDTLSAGGIADLSGNGRNGSPNDVNNIGTTDLSFSTDVPAAIGSGMSLLSSGMDNILADSVSYPGVTGSGSRTVAMWVRIGGGIATSNNMHIAEWGLNATGERWTLRRENAQANSTIGGLRTEIQGDFRTTNTGGPSLNDEQWHHVATVFDTSMGATLDSVTMYFDGVAIGSYLDNANMTGINTADGGPLAFGGSIAFTDRQWEGWIDEAGVWSRALSAAEVAQLAAGARIPEPSAPLLVLTGVILGAARRRRR